MSLNQLKQLTVRDASLNLRCESINAQTVDINTLNVEDITITNDLTVDGFARLENVASKNLSIKGDDYELLNQITSITTPVSGTNKTYTLINTELATTAPGAYTRFVFSNTLIEPGVSIVLCNVVNYNSWVVGTGIPIVNADTLIEGSCEIIIANAGENALDAPMRILVTVINRIP